MQLDKLTLKSQEALQEAQRIAHGYSHQEVDCEHLLLALLGQNESLVPELLQKIGTPPAKLQPDLEKELARRHKVQGTSSSDVYLSPNLKKALDAIALLPRYHQNCQKRRAPSAGFYPGIHRANRRFFHEHILRHRC